MRGRQRAGGGHASITLKEARFRLRVTRIYRQRHLA